MTKARGRPPHADVLTPAEWRVIEAVRHGMSNAQIARRRGISLDAVKYHVANAVAKLGVSGRAALKTWPGVRKDSHLARRTPMLKTLEKPASLDLGPIGQVSRSVGDIDEAVRWYRDVLGLRHLFTAGQRAFFDLGGVRLYLEQGEAKAESILYLKVADILAAHDELRCRGVVFDYAPHLVHRHADGTEEWMAFFGDPDGRPLALMSQVAAADG